MTDLLPSQNVSRESLETIAIRVSMPPLSGASGGWWAEAVTLRTHFAGPVKRTSGEPMLCLGLAAGIGATAI